MSKDFKSRQPSPLLGECLVCAKKIREGEEHLKVFHGGTYRLVCCASCAAKFEESPAYYVSQQRR